MESNLYNGQFHQDKFVDEYLDHKEGGLFLDIGGCRPIKTNNTYFFETERNWTGVIVEANPELIQNLRKYRPGSVILNNAIWSEDCGDLGFTVLKNHYSLSSLNVNHNDEHINKRLSDSSYTADVESISISTIFEEMGWSLIDYLSLDIEGGEVEALEGMDFSRHNARCVTVEHNKVDENREKIEFILTSNNYRKVKSGVRMRYLDGLDEKAQKLFWMEDWYVLKFG